MKLYLTIFTSIVSILLMVTILLQQRGSGIGRAFGGESGVYRTRRGAERFLLIFTIVLAILFAGGAIANILLTN
jgi:protein translocase SecG subunit